jgi:carbon-monoxide dehydrogenase large subunit
MRFANTRLSAVPLEGRACLADFDRLTGRLTVHASTQAPHLLQRKIATCLQMRLGQVRVMSHDVGGGFGQKIPASPEEIAIPLAARALGRPVRWVEDRRENLVAGPQAKDQILDLTLAFDESGEFRALRGQIFGDAGAYSFNSASALIEAYLASGLLTGPYRIPEVERSVLVARPTPSEYARRQRLPVPHGNRNALRQRQPRRGDDQGLGHGRRL